MAGVEVEVSRQLSAEMQAVADCREAVKKAEAEVEHCKGELKTAKAVLEECQEQLNAAVDAAIEAERRPTLFSGLGDDLRDVGEQQAPRTVESEPAGEPLAVDPGDVVFDRIPAGEVEGRPGLIALPPASVPADDDGDDDSAAAVISSPLLSAPSWRRLTLDEAFETEVDIPTDVISAIKIKGVITVGNLADLLLAGETFGLRLIDVQAVCESIETMSADDAYPVKFSGDDDREFVEGGEDGPVGEGEPAGSLLGDVPEPEPEPVPEPTPEPEPEPEPVAKGKGRGRKKGGRVTS